jgi:hypothetical protein
MLNEQLALVKLGLQLVAIITELKGWLMIEDAIGRCIVVER